MRLQFLFIGAAALACTFSGISASAATLTFKYNKSSKTATVTGWTGTEPSGELRIPLQSTNPDDGIKYNVTAVAEGVFNNLDNVTSIYIRKNIKKIGSLTGNSTSSPEPGLANFQGMPNLQFIEVEDGNKYFRNTGAGMLTSYDGTILYRVPEDINTSAGGRINLSSSITTIEKGAFTGNHTIKILSLPKSLTTINYNGGLNWMTALEKYEIDAGCKAFNISKGALCKGTTYIVSMPPLSTATSYKLSSTITGIEYGAFANCKNLKSITYNNLIWSIDDYAFAGSGLITAEIPSTVDHQLGHYIFDNCRSLTDIAVHTPGIRISRGFARNATALKKITFDGAPHSFGNSAFYGCSSLTEFPFRPEAIYGDSVFARCGFEKIEFSEGIFHERMSAPKALFIACKNLHTIDMSKVRADDADNFDWDFYDEFASYCPKLTTVIFPGHFSSEGTPFAGCDALKKIVVKTFYAYDKLFTVSGNVTLAPDVYVNAHTHHKDALLNSEYKGINMLFATSDGARIAANIYIDYYNPTEKTTSEGGGITITHTPNYVIPGCIYHIPGYTKRNYSLAPEIAEMYGISFSKDSYSGKGIIQTTSLLDGVVMHGCSFNGTSQIPFYNGRCASDINYNSISTIEVSYSVNGVEMSTTYPAEAFLTPDTGVDDILTDGDSMEPYSIITSSGITVASGTGIPDTDSLPHGMYLIVRPRGTTKIIL